MFEPVIKWSGSKRSQSEEILRYFPDEIGTYVEPFCGGASMTRALIESGKKVGKYVCSDLNKDLINLWNSIKEHPETVYSRYAERWHELNDQDDDKERKKRYFEQVRELYNREGCFNNSFHVTRNGIAPERAKRVIFEWSDILQKNDVSFIHSDYRDIDTTEDTFMYLDPPYAGTKGMYFGGFDNRALFEWLGKQPCRWVMSYDGISGDVDNTYSVPEELYSRHVYIKSGNSSFKRVIGKSNDSVVFESLYIK